MSATLLLAPLLDFQTFHKLLVNVSICQNLGAPPGPSRFRRPCSHCCSKHTYLIVKIYTLLGSFNDVKNASVRTHVLTGTYFSQIAQHISQKFYHQI